MRTPNYDFKKDVVIAEKTQIQIAKYLEKTQGMKFLDESSVAKGNHADYDIRMLTPGQREITIEIKEDFTCERTGNVGVEYECRGYPSGINRSKADFYMYKIHRPDSKVGLYVVQTSKLKQMIADELYFRTVVGGDPGSNSKCYLFKLDVIANNFKFLGYMGD